METPAILMNRNPKNLNNRLPKDPRDIKQQLRRGDNLYSATFPTFSFKIYQQTSEIPKIRH